MKVTLNTYLEGTRGLILREEGVRNVHIDTEREGSGGRDVFFEIEVEDGYEIGEVWNRAFDKAQQAEWALRDETGEPWYFWVEHQGAILIE